MGDDIIRMNPGSIPVYDGDYNKFQLWWRKLKASGYLAGFGDTIGEEKDPNLPESYAIPIDTGTEEGTLKKLAKKQNDVAMSCFTMAFITDGIMALVSKAVTKDWPRGLAYLDVQGLI
jgi:hypothetical protein